MKEICIAGSCTGCKVCGDICQANAIQFKNDNEGFWYPVIDESLCINCQKCVKHCPQNKSFDFEKNNVVSYLAWNNNKTIKKKSSSGGIFYSLAKKVLHDGGCVVGCSFRNDYTEVGHIIINSENELGCILGSKYVQSDTAGIYNKVNEELESGRKVLFSGTPCQIAGLYTFLGEKIYPKLITVDFACWGINSPMVYQQYLMQRKKQYNADITKFEFRNKLYGWENYSINIEFNNENIYNCVNSSDRYMNGFTHDVTYFMRNSCYHCNYRSIPHHSDITLGDYWGIQNISKETRQSGVSLVILNSPEGLELFNRIRNEITAGRCNINDIIKNNAAFTVNPINASDRKCFFEMMQEHGFDYAADQCYNNHLKDNNEKYQPNEQLEKYKEFYQLFNAWLILKNQNIGLYKYFYDNNYASIGIYGFKELGKRLLEELNSNKIEIKFIMDKNVRINDDNIKIPQLISPQDKIPEVDVIVVTAIHYIDEIKNELMKKTTADIISLEDVVYSLMLRGE